MARKNCLIDGTEGMAVFVLNPALKQFLPDNPSAVAKLGELSLDEFWHGIECGAIWPGMSCRDAEQIRVATTHNRTGRLTQAFEFEHLSKRRVDFFKLLSSENGDKE